LESPVVLAAGLIALLGPVHAVVEVVVRQSFLNDVSDLLLGLFSHLGGSGVDGHIVEVQDMVQEPWRPARVRDLVVLVVGVEDLDVAQLSGVVTHCGLAGVVVWMVRLAAAVHGSGNTVISTPPVTRVETSEVEADGTLISLLEFLGDAFSSVGVHVVLVSEDLVPLTEVGFLVEFLDVINLWAASPSEFGLSSSNESDHGKFVHLY
jgi:hypothetical protein